MLNNRKVNPKQTKRWQRQRCAQVGHLPGLPGLVRLSLARSIGGTSLCVTETGSLGSHENTWDLGSFMGCDSVIGCFSGDSGC